MQPYSIHSCREVLLSCASLGNSMPVGYIVLLLSPGPCTRCCHASAAQVCHLHSISTALSGKSTRKGHT